MTRIRCGSAGFTLIEILIVISIFGVLTAIGSSMFVSVTSAWNERKTIAELDAQAELALESIREDISAALSSSVSGKAIAGASREVADSRTYPPARHADDDLMIPVQAIDPERPLAVPAMVGYRVDRSPEGGILVRSIGPLDGNFPSGNRLEIMPGARVLGFSVEYLTRSGASVWVDQWTGSGMPAAVRVCLSIEDLDRPNQFQVTRKVVVPVRVE